MSHNVEAMDVDSSVCDFDNKENSCHHNNVLPRSPCTEKGYEELDVTELNMKLRYSLSPSESSMSNSFTANCLENQNCESGNNKAVDNCNLTRSLNSSITKSDVTIKSLKVKPRQVLTVDQSVDSNRNPLQSLEPTINNNVTVTVSGSYGNDEAISLPSTLSSMVHTPEALTPTNDIQNTDDGSSPILRGLKSVLKMFRSSQSPIPPEGENKPQDKEVLSPSLINSPETADSRPQAILASTPLAAYKTKDALSKRNSPNRDSLVFNDDLEKELHWKDETTILFSEEKIPIHKLFLTSASMQHASNNPDDVSNQGKRDAIVEYMDISYNDTLYTDKTTTEIQCRVIPSKSMAVESDSEFLDCESSFTQNESQLEFSFQSPPHDNIIGNLPLVENKLQNEELLNLTATEESGNTIEESVNATITVKSTDLSVTPTGMKELYTDFGTVPVPQKAIDVVKQEEFEVKILPSALDKGVLLERPELTTAHMGDQPTSPTGESLEVIRNVEHFSIHEANAFNNSYSLHDTTQPNLIPDFSKVVGLVKVNIVDTASTPDIGIGSLSQIPLIADPRVLLFNIPLQDPIDKIETQHEKVDNNIILDILSPADIPLPEDSKVEKNVFLSTVVNNDLIQNNLTNTIKLPIGNICDQAIESVVEENNLKIKETVVGPNISVHGESNNLDSDKLHHNLHRIDFQRNNVPSIEVNQNVSNDPACLAEDMAISSDLVKESSEPTTGNENSVTLADVAIIEKKNKDIQENITKEILIVASNVTITDESVPSKKDINNLHPEKSTSVAVIAKENVGSEKNLEPEVALPMGEFVGDCFSGRVPQRICPIEVENKVDIDAAGINLVNNINTTRKIDLSDEKEEEAIAFVTDTDIELVIPQGNSPVIHHDVITALESSASKIPSVAIDVTENNKEVEGLQGKELDTTPDVIKPSDGINTLSTILSEDENGLKIVESKNKEVEVFKETGAQEFDYKSEVIKPTDDINTSSTILPATEIATNTKDGTICLQIEVQEMDTNTSKITKPTNDFNKSVTNLHVNEIARMIEELDINHEEAGIVIETRVQNILTNTSNVIKIKPTDDVVISTPILPDAGIAPTLENNEINIPSNDCIIHAVSYNTEDNSSVKEEPQNHDTLDKNEIKLECVDEEIIVSESNSPFVSVTAGDILCNEALEEIENLLTTKTIIQMSPPCSPKIVSKGYNFNFDEMDNPFATKTKIRSSPPPGASPNQSFDQFEQNSEISKRELSLSRQQSLPERKKRPVTNLKNNSTFAASPTDHKFAYKSQDVLVSTIVEDKITTFSDGITLDVEQNKAEDIFSTGATKELLKSIIVSSDTEMSTDMIHNIDFKPSIESVTTLPNETKKIQMSPPCSPKIVSKGYNFNFDELDDPFATKTKIRSSPPPGASPNQSFDHFEQKSEFSNKELTSSRRKSQPEMKKRSVANKKINSTLSASPTDYNIADKAQVFSASTIVEDKITTSSDGITMDVKQNKADDILSTGATKELLKSVIVSKIFDTEESSDIIQNVDFKSPIESVTTLPNDTKNTSSSERSTYYSAGSSSTEGINPKNVFTLPELDDKNFNPFSTKSKIRQSPPASPSLERNVPFDLKSNVSSPGFLNVYDSNKNAFNADTTVNIEPTCCLPTIVTNLEDKAEILGIDLKEKDLTDNIDMTSSSNVSDMDNTVKTVRTEDQDTIEDPFLEAEDLDDDKMTDFSADNADMMRFSDFPAPGNDDNDAAELFIDAEAFEFLLNQNQANVVADSGKESLFLKFDPLFAKRMSSDGVVAALNKVHKRQSTPKKQTSPPTKKILKSPIAGPSMLNVMPKMEINNVTEESNDDFNITISKPMMVVNPAVNPIVTPRNKTITPVRTNRQSLTFTSPAIAVIDRLLSMSANNSLVSHDDSISVNNEQYEANRALTQLRELLAEKEINVYNLRSESIELKDRLISLESQMHTLESISEERLKKINELTDKVNEKTKTNKCMATVVAEYERTVASLITETEQEKNRHAEERIQLVKERDEQTNHLASMEVSFSDLHSKYEKSKQVILALKANEETVKKSIKEFEVNVAKMQNNYELLKQHATSKLNHANEELQKMNRAHESEMLKLNAMIKRKELHITSLEETLLQKTKANEELTAICDELINKVG